MAQDQQQQQHSAAKNIDYLISLLDNEYENSVYYALTQLKALSSNNDGNKEMICSKGAVQRCMPLLGPRHKNVIHDKTLRLLRSLSVVSRNQVEIANAGAIPLLLDFVRGADPVLQVNAVAVLWNLSVHEQNKDAIGRSGGVDALVELLSRTNRDNVRNEVVGALRNLSHYPPNRTRIVRTGGVPLLLGMLDPSRSRDTTRRHAVVALVQCANDPAGINALRQCGGNTLLALEETCQEIDSQIYRELRQYMTAAGIDQQQQQQQHRSGGGGRTGGHGPGAGAGAGGGSAARLLEGRDAMANEEMCMPFATETFGTMQWSALDLGDKVGAGAYAKVYKAYYHGYPVAVKLLNDPLPDDPSRREKMMQEFKLMSMLRHPNCLLYMGSALTPDNRLAIVSEFCHSVDTRVLLANGETKRAGDLTTEDKLIGDDGLVRRITHLKTRKANVMFKISWSYSKMRRFYVEKRITKRLRNENTKPLAADISLKGKMKSGENIGNQVYDYFLCTPGHTLVICIGPIFPRITPQRQKQRTFAVHRPTTVYDRSLGFHRLALTSEHKLFATREEAMDYANSIREEVSSWNWEVQANHFEQFANRYPSLAGLCMLRRVPVDNFPIQSSVHIGSMIRTQYKATGMEVLWEMGGGIQAEEFAWMLGLWFGDGKSNAPAFAVNSSLEPEIEACLFVLASKLGLVSRATVVKCKDGDVEKNCVVRSVALSRGEASRNTFSELLKTLGVFDTGKNIPEETIGALVSQSREFRFALLAGIIDSDGSLFTPRSMTQDETEFSLPRWFDATQKDNVRRALSSVNTSTSKVEIEQSLNPLRNMRKNPACEVKGYYYVVTQYTQRSSIIELARRLAHSLGYSCVTRHMESTDTKNGRVCERFELLISGDSIDDIPCVVRRKRVNTENYNRKSTKDTLKRPFIIERVDDGPYDYVEMTTDGNSRYLLDDFTVTHNCDRGTLKENMRTVRSMTQRLKFAKDVACGLSWMHANNVIHRDLKPANILISSDWSARLSDFGLSLVWFESCVCLRFKGNVKYAAPEILRVRAHSDRQRARMTYAYGPQTDVYSYALILWELVTDEPLFEGIRGKEEITEFVCGGNRPELVPGWPKSLSNLLERCWSQDPNQRYLFPHIQSQFSNVMIDFLCPDPMGRRIARDLWLGDEMRRVPYSQFEEKFEERCRIDLDTGSQCYRRCLQTMLCNPQDNLVTFQSWCNCIHWMGSMTPIKDFLNRLVHLFEQPWFFGFIRSTDAKRLLLEQQRRTPDAAGYYLIRFSENSPGSYSIYSIDHEGRTSHRRISHQYSSTYCVTLDGQQGREFADLCTLHDQCCETGTCLQGLDPLPGAPYQCYFAAHPLRTTTTTTAAATKRTSPQMLQQPQQPQQRQQPQQPQQPRPQGVSAPQTPSPNTVYKMI